MTRAGKYSVPAHIPSAHPDVAMLLNLVFVILMRFFMLLLHLYVSVDNENTWKYL